MKTLTLAAVMAVVLSIVLMMAGPTVFAQEEEASDVSVVSLEVSPAAPVRGDTISVTATVMNSATSTREQLLELMVGGVTVDSLTVSLAPEETKIVGFSFDTTTAGDVDVTVGEVTTQVSIAEPQSATAVPQAATAVPQPATAVPQPATAVPKAAGEVPQKGIVRSAPSVRLSSVQTQITSDQDAKFNLYWHNSELNEVTFKIEVSLDVPAGMYIYSQDGAMACAAGRCLGVFDAAPKTVRDMPIYIRSNKEGTYFIRLHGRYWPEDDPDSWNVLNLDTTIEVLEVSDPPLIPPESAPTSSASDPASTPGPSSTPVNGGPEGPLGLPLLAWALLVIVVIAVAGFWAIPRTVRAARAKAPRIEVN